MVLRLSPRPLACSAECGGTRRSHAFGAQLRAGQGRRWRHPERWVAAPIRATGHGGRRAQGHAASDHRAVVLVPGAPRVQSHDKWLAVLQRAEHGADLQQVAQRGHVPHLQIGRRLDRLRKLSLRLHHLLGGRGVRFPLGGVSATLPRPDGLPLHWRRALELRHHRAVQRPQPKDRCLVDEPSPQGLQGVVHQSVPGWQPSLVQSGVRSLPMQAQPHSSQGLGLRGCVPIQPLGS